MAKSVMLGLDREEWSTAIQALKKAWMETKLTDKVLARQYRKSQTALGSRMNALREEYGLFWIAMGHEEACRTIRQFRELELPVPRRIDLTPRETVEERETRNVLKARKEMMRAGQAIARQEGRLASYDRLMRQTPTPGTKQYKENRP